MASSSAHRGRAIVSRGPIKAGKWAVEEVTLRPIKDNELVVEMVASGICKLQEHCIDYVLTQEGHTDLYFGDAEPAPPFMFYPRVLGHEGGSAYTRS